MKILVQLLAGNGFGDTLFALKSLLIMMRNRPEHSYVLEAVQFDKVKEIAKSFDLLYDCNLSDTLEPYCICSPKCPVEKIDCQIPWYRSKPDLILQLAIPDANSRYPDVTTIKIDEYSGWRKDVITSGMGEKEVGVHTLFPSKSKLKYEKRYRGYFGYHDFRYTLDSHILFKELDILKKFIATAIFSSKEDSVVFNLIIGVSKSDIIDKLLKNMGYERNSKDNFYFNFSNLKSVRINYLSNVSYQEMCCYIFYSEREILLTGDQSFIEGVSCNKLIFYIARPWKKDSYNNYLEIVKRTDWGRYQPLRIISNRHRENFYLSKLRFSSLMKDARTITSMIHKRKFKKVILKDISDYLLKILPE